MTPGEPVIKLNDNGTFFEGFVISVGYNMWGEQMYFAQRPIDGAYFFGKVSEVKRKLPPLSTGGKY